MNFIRRKIHFELCEDCSDFYMEKVLHENPGKYAVVKLMPPVYEATQVVVESKIAAFGLVGKAVL